ncbi:MAG TPA: glycine dehydrogenase, partial [Bryobacteraceae bacterium]|nr:glycine dehydrogenase [Bryobacteraceae bacterium]
QGMPVEEFDYVRESGAVDLEALERKLGQDVAAVIVQSPNFFGVVEEIGKIADAAHSHGALLVSTFAEAVALGILEPPKEADIVAGELQSFAISPSYGGPYAGIIATKEKFIRQIPGRLVGETKDSNGKRAFCLTLSTREQHIRREKATSNICTNQALIALMATVFMTVYGKQGLRELALQNLAKAHYLADGLPRRFSGNFFNEFVAELPASVNEELLRHKIVGGLPLARFYPELEGCMLVCATETSRREHMDVFRQVAQSATQQGSLVAAERGAR